MSGGFDQAGALSIVVHGPADAAVAQNCAHWRRLFPQAQLICVTSQNTDGTALDQTLAARLTISCDTVLPAPAASSLPPMKTDSAGPNYVNQMIVAARAGLAAATGHHVLRVRSDLVFRNRAFLGAYVAGTALPRGPRRLFEHRVMIGEIFTLNPFTHVRLPFHFSDWFHFGLADDVSAIWRAAEPQDVNDGVFYAARPHRAGSNAVERRFLAHIAPEQAVHFPVFAHAFPDLTLTCHNDLTDRDTSLAVLADNFVLANLQSIGAELPKYRDVIETMSPYTRLECLSQAHLRALALRPCVSPATLFAEDIARTRRYGRSIARLRRRVRRTWFACLRRMRTTRG